MQLNSKYDQIPSDSDASIYTQGLLGGKFIGLTAGGSDTYLKNNDQIDFTQSAIVLENLIGQLVANFSNKGSDSSGSAPTTTPPSKPEKTK
jgi:phospholipid/cholesterol/gamma-HCH transport system substrate-binding protein